MLVADLKRMAKKPAGELLKIEQVAERLTGAWVVCARGACAARDRLRFVLATRCGGIRKKLMNGWTRDVKHARAQGD